MDSPAITIVIPVHNEAGNIGPLVRETAEAFAGVAAEIICVDDASRDGSVEEIRAVAADLPFVRLLRHDGQYGQSAAVWTGGTHAAAPWIGTMDGDGQNDPRDLRRMWDHVAALPADARPALVAGVRQKRQTGAFKVAASRIANGVRARLLRDDSPDTGCGLKLVARETFAALPFFNNMHRFLPALVRRAGGAVVQFPVGDRPRRHGTSNYRILDRFLVGVTDLMGVWWLRRRGRFPKLRKEQER